jgi:molybdate transport system permease protein
MFNAEDWAILLFTLQMAALSTLVILPAGVAAGYALARWRGPGKEIVETLLSLPLVLPPTAVGLLLLALVGRRGLAGGALARAGLDIAFTWKAVVLAIAVMSFPLLVRSARTAFEEVDGRLVGLARALGEFGATILVAGNIPGRTQTLALAIYQRVQIGADGAAFRLVALTTLLAFVAVWTTEIVTRRCRRRFATGSDAP